MSFHLQIGRNAAIMLVAAGFLWSGGAGLPGLQQAQAQAPGPEVCAGCHESQVKTFMGTKHGNKVDARTPLSQGGCNVCHKGDIAAHVKAGGGKGVGGMVSLSSKTIAQEDKDQTLPGLPPEGPAAHELAVEHPCQPRHRLHVLPPDPHLARQGARQAHPAAGLLRLPQGAARPDQQALAPPDPGRQGELRRLPQRARQQSQADGQEQRQRGLLHLPHGKARSLRAQPPAGDRRLHASATSRTARPSPTCSSRARRSCARTATQSSGHPSQARRHSDRQDQQHSVSWARWRGAA